MADDEPGVDAPGVDAWKARTSAFDRVQSVASTVSRPQSATDIAAEAHVAENTARDHLERLVEINVLLKRDREGTAVYAPDPLHTRMQTLRDLLDTHDHEGLLRLKAELLDRIEEWREEYEVGSPEELRERGADADDATETREILRAASDWELVAYRLGIVEDAIENYATYSRENRASA
ncbi:ArsR family transcriptional regulator [Halovivax sp.]|uniref:DUF7342 family protein n=1 Tax=Halovivax sp. TaxID=1935978 RepID=UPI0025B89F19|nr:ArsR family transcriptional regulator [Halovivax sp.]